TDIVRRRGAFGQRIKQVPATGHPSRFFEQTAIVSPSAATAFVDPRNIVATVGSPTRVERSLPLKALVSQINYNLFDMEVGAQQSQFAFLQAKDLADSVEGLMRTHDVALWNGNDTSLGTPTTTQAGDLPLVPEWALGYTGTPGSGTAVLPAYIVSEDLIEHHWLTDGNPHVFQLGLQGSLASQMVVVKFGGVVVKGASYAHYEV